ncbi:hypothetical protein SNEBB_004694, partial [Seison nebaliae]
WKEKEASIFNNEFKESKHRPFSIC